MATAEQLKSCAQRTRAEHLAWCKQRALEYADKGNAAQALASITSDLLKHSDTADSAKVAAFVGLATLAGGGPKTPDQIRHFIEGFN